MFLERNFSLSKKFNFGHDNCPLLFLHIHLPNQTIETQVPYYNCANFDDEIHGKNWCFRFYTATNGKGSRLLWFNNQRYRGDISMLSPYKQNFGKQIPERLWWTRLVCKVVLLPKIKTVNSIKNSWMKRSRKVMFFFITNGRSSSSISCIKW